MNLKAKARARQELRDIPGARHQLDNGETPVEEKHSTPPWKRFGLPEFPSGKHYAAAIPLLVNFEAKARARQELHYVPGARHQLDYGEAHTEVKQ